MIEPAPIQNAAVATAAFLASLVECVEALTIVLAVGSVRGWLCSLVGAFLGAVLLVLSIILAGGALLHVAVNDLHIVIGAILLPFGVSWLRKPVLRVARLKALRNEAVIFDRQIANLGCGLPAPRGYRLDLPGAAVAFKAVVIEGAEVVVLVVMFGHTAGALVPAALGAAAAAFLVITLGIAIHRPLTRVPENALKFCVGVVIVSFGIFWLGEGLRLQWPGGDVALIAIMASVFATSYLWAAILRGRTIRQGNQPGLLTKVS